MRKNDNNWLKYLIILCLLTVFAIGGFLFYKNQYQQNSTNNKLTKIKVAQFADVFLYMPLYIAKDKGFFEKQGLDVDIVSTGGDDKTYAAVISGDAQFGIADPTFVAIARSKGQGGQVIASIVNGVPFWGVTKKKEIPEIKDPKMLKDYSVATFPAPSTAYVLQEEMFEDGGLKPNIKQAAFGTLLTQLETGQADIALELEPNVSTAVNQGARIVYSMPERYGDFAITGVSVSEEMIQKNPEEVQRFVNAIEMALVFARENPTEAIEIASKRFPSLDKEVVAQALKRMIDTNTLPKTTVISQEAWDKAIDLRIDSGDLKATIEEARKTLNNSFSQKSIEAIKK
jgi:NitT/TauT family transport system substrate-binding protein